MTMNVTKALSVFQTFSPRKLEKQGHIKRSEVNIDHVVLYLDEVSKNKERSPNRGQDHSLKGIKFIATIVG